MKSEELTNADDKQHNKTSLELSTVIFHLLLMKKPRRQLSSKLTHRIPWGVKIPVLLSVASSMLAVGVHHNIAISLDLKGTHIDAVFATKDAATSHPPILYGHVHMAKTGGTSLNGILANTFERVCGHKGYSYDAFQDNERAKILEKEGQRIRPQGRSKVKPLIMKEIGFEECDYISQES